MPRLVGKANGRWRPALERFAEKCAFDPYTGCVMWVGGTTKGHGKNALYGSFWDAGKRWFAHRWSAHHIHGLDTHGFPVGHVCPCGPSTLCVEHLAGMTVAENNAMIKTNPGRFHQNTETKRHWIYVEVGIEEYQAPVREIPGIPFFTPPDWLKPFLPKEEFSDACPF